MFKKSFLALAQKFQVVHVYIYHKLSVTHILPFNQRALKGSSCFTFVFFLNNEIIFSFTTMFCFELGGKTLNVISVYSHFLKQR